MWKLESSKFFIRYEDHIEQPSFLLLVVFNIFLIPKKLYLEERFVHKNWEFSVYLDMIPPVKYPYRISSMLVHSLSFN